MLDRVRRWALLALTAAAAAVVVVGVVGDSSGTEEDRVASIASSLRCPACQSVSVEEASAPIARDMRNEIAAQVAAGRSDAEIKAFFADKYGDWVILDTPPRGRTLLLWLLPGLALGFGVLAIGSRLRKPVGSSAPVEAVEPSEARKIEYRCARNCVLEVDEPDLAVIEHVARNEIIVARRLRRKARLESARELKKIIAPTTLLRSQ